jgi:hypothetical protein
MSTLSIIRIRLTSFGGKYTLTRGLGGEYIMLQI